MRRLVRLALHVGLVAALAASTIAKAQTTWAPSAGVFDVGKSETAVEVGLELRLRALFWGIRPIAGVMATSDESAYAYLGGRREFAVGDRWWITPALAAGAYRQGDGKDLGRVLEFRSALEVAREVGRGRVGLTYYHLSNASLSDVNPGSESLVLSWELPLGR